MERSLPAKENGARAPPPWGAGDSCARYQARPCWSVATICMRLLWLCAMTTRPTGPAPPVGLSRDQVVQVPALAAVSWRTHSSPEGVTPSRASRPSAFVSAPTVVQPVVTDWVQGDQALLPAAVCSR